jgi:hypothetical protein
VQSGRKRIFQKERKKKKVYFEKQLLPAAVGGGRVARFFPVQHTKTVRILSIDHKMYQNGHKMYQRAVDYTKYQYIIRTISIPKALHNIPKLVFLVQKFTIWQHWVAVL